MGCFCYKTLLFYKYIKHTAKVLARNRAKEGRKESKENAAT